MTTTSAPESATRTFGPRPPQPPPAPIRRTVLPRLPRPAALAALGLLAALAVTTTAWPTGSGPSAATGPDDSYVRVLEGLDARRAAAFATGEVSQLRLVYVDGAPALTEDLRVLRAYVRQGRRVAGLRHEVRSVTLLAESADEVRLRVLDVVPPFRVVDGAGRAVERHAGRAERSWNLTLRRVGGRWRVAEVAES